MQKLTIETISAVGIQLKSVTEREEGERWGGRVDRKMEKGREQERGDP